VPRFNYEVSDSTTIYCYQLNRREHMASMSLIIVNFEGIIGDVAKLSFFDADKRQALYLKRGVVAGIKRLMEKFQVVLVCSQAEYKINSILSYFKSNKIVFDGVYVKPREHLNSILMSYTQIFNDFEISLEDVKWQVLILCTICLENEEIKSRDGDTLLFEKVVNHEKVFFPKNL